jgi:hypothetical protein
MTRGESLLTVNPLFYEALSGEFLPVGSETSHTIGRLAVATFQKGEIADDSRTNLSNDLWYEVNYSPSWANDVKSSVLCLEHHGRSDHALLRHIILMREDESLRIADESYFRSKQTVKLVRNGNATTLPANLGSEVLSARNAITQAAQEFFA